MKCKNFKHFCVTIGNLPSSYVDSMSYYELLMWFCKFLNETVIPAINDNAEAVKEIQKWIENLDLQDEVNNKLDEMAASGELTELISAYLNLKAQLCFDTVADLKGSTNIVDGSYAKTLGYYSKNDGGSSLYKIRTITNDDVLDESFIINLDKDDLIAELIILDEINVNMLGAKADENFDNTEKVNISIDKLGYAKFLSGTYLLNLNIVEDKELEIYGVSNTILKSYTSNSNVINILNNSITKYKRIHNLRFELSGNENAVKVALPSFVDNYYPNAVDIHDLDIFVNNNFTGNCIDLEYIREINVNNIYCKRDRISDVSRTGTAINLISCMNVNITNGSAGFFDKAVSITNGTMSSEGIKVDNFEMFFNNYGVYSQSNSAKAVLDVRIVNCMIDQVQVSGVTLDGVTSSSISNCWIGVNIADANAIDLKSTNRETAFCSILGNSLYMNVKDNAYCVLIDRSSTNTMRNITISDNLIYNHKEVAVKLVGNAINSLIFNNNNISTSSGVNNMPISYENKPIHNTLSGNIYEGATFRNKDLNLSNNYNMSSSMIITDIVTGSTQQNPYDRPVQVFVSGLTSQTGKKIVVFLGTGAGSVQEMISFKISNTTAAGQLEGFSFIIPPKYYYAINPSEGMVTVVKSVLL